MASMETWAPYGIVASMAADPANGYEIRLVYKSRLYTVPGSVGIPSTASSASPSITTQYPPVVRCQTVNQPSS